MIAKIPLGNGTIFDVKTKEEDKTSSFFNMKWFKLIDFENLYEITRKGDVRSLAKRNYHNFIPQQLKKGYYCVNIWKDNKMFTKSVHRLVARMFVSNPNNLPEVNHEDGIKTNNWDWNLKWNTRSQNQQHAYDTGLQKPPGEKPILQYTKDGTLLKEFKSIHEAGKQTGISFKNISACIIRKTYNSGGYTWKLKVEKNV